MDWYIGSHHAREEGAVLVLTLVGELSLQDVKQIITALDRLIERHGHYGTLIDMEKLGTFRPDARIRAHAPIQHPAQDRHQRA